MADSQLGSWRPAAGRFTNFTDFFSALAHEQPDDCALIHPLGSLTFAELEGLIWQSAGYLRSQGVAAGDVLVPAGTDELSILLASLGAMRLGATVFSLPGGLSRIARREEFERAGVTVVAGRRPGLEAPAVRSIAFDAMRFGTGPAAIDTTARVAAPEAPAVLGSTSGSTGRSRLIPLGHRSYLQRLDGTFSRPLVPGEDRVYSQVHLDFETGRRIVVSAMYYGATAVLADRRGATLVDIALRHGITVLWTSVADLEVALDRLPAGAPRPALPLLRELVVGTATVGASLRERAMTRLSPNVYVRYGTNECGLVSTATPQQSREVPGTVGRPAPGVEIEIVDRDGRPVAAGETGHVRMRRPGMFAGYLNDAEATARALRDGWYYPGDFARWSPDGQLIHCGRVDDMMMVSGLNIYPAEIERALGEHPAVREVSAFPLPDRIAQDIPVAAVVLHDGVQAGGDELAAFAQERLGARAPCRIIHLERLPRTPQGKVDRQALRADVAQRLRRRRATSASVPVRRERLQFGFPCSPPDQLDVIANRFAQWLRLEPVALGGPGGQAEGSGERRAALRFLSHALALTLQLLQSGGVPVFGDVRVEHFAARPDDRGRWAVVVALPSVERIARTVYEQAVRAALDACLAMAGRGLDDGMRAAFDAGFAQTIEFISQRAPQGKPDVALLRAAHAHEIPYVHLGRGIYQLGWGSRGMLTHRALTPGDSAIGAQTVQSKHAVASMLDVAGLPTAGHGLASTLEQAQQWAQRLGWPLVVKPDDTTGRDSGARAGIDSDAGLQEAFEAVAGDGKRMVVVERQVPGHCHRLMLVRGQLLYAVQRLPVSVTGDGSSTIAALIAQAARRERELPPWLRSGFRPARDEVQATLAALGQTLEAVPPAGVPVPLERTRSRNAHGFDRDVSADVHPGNVEAAARAASLFDLDVAAVDFVSTDIGQPWHANGAVIIGVQCMALLDGSEVSQRHLPAFLEYFVQGDGRIPVEVVEDADADLALARSRQQELGQDGLRCWLTSATRTIANDGREIVMPFASLEERFRALVLERTVDAVVVAVPPREGVVGVSHTPAPDAQAGVRGS